MPNPDPTVVELMREAGFEGESVSNQQLQHAAHSLKLVRSNPRAAVLEMLRSEREKNLARQECGRATAAATELEGLLGKLLESDTMLCRLEHLQTGDSGPPRALCRLGGQLRHVPVHPDVAVEELSRLQPWHFICVNPRDMVVVGTCTDERLFGGALGSLVEFKGYHDRSRGLVRVAREGHDEEIVELATAVSETPLTKAHKLVLQRDNERFAISTVSAERAESKFEVPIDQIETRLEDLAGMEDIVEKLVEDILLRLVHPDIRECFDLRPLRGMLLYSYKPGMGKTALIRAVAAWLGGEMSEDLGFEVALYVVKPNELKSIWHGGDARLVRDELCGAIRARQATPRSKPLLQIVVLDEIDSLGKRAGGDDVGGYVSSAHNDAVQSLLVEMDGMVQQIETSDNPPAHVLWVGLTNVPDLVDHALKRPGRFGDLVLEMDDLTIDAAEAILAVYARKQSIPWYLDETVRDGVTGEEIRTCVLRPALARVFPTVVLRFATDSQRSIDVTAGQVLAGVHYMDALNVAKKRAATRSLLGVGPPAVGFDDVLEGLLEQARATARQMAADRQMFMRQLRIKTPVTRVEVVSDDELSSHRFLRLAAG